MTAIIVIVVVVILAAWLVSMYNSLVKMRNNRENAFADIDVQLKQRHDLVPQLVETVKGYAAHEKDTLERVINARNGAIGAKTIDEKIVAENALSSALSGLKITLEAYPDLKANQNFLQLQEEIADLENKLSVTNPESEISKINSSANNAIKISEDTLTLISTALDVNKKSGGAFDITIYPIVKLWGFTTGKYEVPNKEEILKNLEYVDSSNIKLDEKEGTVTVPENIEIDLGGIAKGYAGKKAAEKIRSMGIESALLNLGGNIQTIGSKPDGSAWGVSICNPEDSSKQLCRIEVVDKAVVTSGGYQRYFEENGKSYHHIIDPKSGYPAENGLLSVTIVDEDGMLCDALSTTLFVLGKDKALEYCEKYGIEAILMTDDKKIYVTDGLKESFSIIDQTSGYFLAE